MNQPSVTPPAAGRPERLLATLEQLLALDATEVKGALNRASDLVGEVLDAEKVDVFCTSPAARRWSPAAPVTLR